jgi:hypothetical protein
MNAEGTPGYTPRGPSKEELDFQRFIAKLNCVQFAASIFTLAIAPWIADWLFSSKNN